MIRSYINIWKKIFALKDHSVDVMKPLTHQILSDPNHEVSKIIVYIYTMEI